MSTALTKEYQKLIERFAPRPIRNAEQKAAAVKLMKELASKGATKRTEDETDYLIVLGRLIADYERTLPSVQKFLKDPISPAESLAYLIEENELTQTQLAEEIGVDQGNLSAFLSGRRGLSKSLAMKLANRFKVSVTQFLPQDIA
jgi:antitoxin component HigA of HigAB toxin-antitoxin module